MSRVLSFQRTKKVRQSQLDCWRCVQPRPNGEVEKQMSKHEAEFWNGVVNDLAPSWNIQLAEGYGQNGGSLSVMSVHVYAINTQTCWIGAASLTEQSMTQVRETAMSLKKKASASASEVAGLAISKLQKFDHQNKKEDVDTALNLAAMALTDTATFDIVKEKTGKLGGEWIYIAYPCQNRSVISRPVFLNSRHNAILMPTQDLRALVKKVVAQDLSQKDTAVYKNIKSQGGALVDPVFLS